MSANFQFFLKVTKQNLCKLARLKIHLVRESWRRFHQ